MVRQRTSAAVCLALLLALNAWILARLFKTEYTPWMSSIEGAYIGLSRWIQTHWTELGWFPLWYAGIPFENAYPPLLHALVAAIASAAGISAAHSHHVVTGAMYCLGPLALFWRNYSGSQKSEFRSQNEDASDEILGLGGVAKGPPVCACGLPFLSDIPPI